MLRAGQRAICTSVVSLALTIGSGCSTTPKSTEQRQHDRETVTAVRSAFESNPHIYTEHVNVDADAGVVHLSGYVWSDYDMYETQRLAESAPGVTKVVNDMELELEGMGNSPVSR